MSCGCSAKDSDKVFSKKTPKEVFVNYSFKTIGFVLILALLPVINLVLIWYMFKMFVLGDTLNLVQMFETISKKITPKAEVEDEDDEDEDLMEDDVVLLDVDDLKLYEINRN